MIDVKTALYIHDNLIDKFGGSRGIRDIGGLEAALNRPFATFDSIDLYPSPIDKAAALLESMVINHPFVDGNKRTAYVLMKLLLFKNGINIKANQGEKYLMVLSASKGEIRIDEIKLWLQSKTSKNQ
jgi:death-on-curing protein